MCFFVTDQERIAIIEYDLFEFLIFKFVYIETECGIFYSSAKGIYQIISQCVITGFVLAGYNNISHSVKFPIIINETFINRKFSTFLLNVLNRRQLSHFRFLFFAVSHNYCFL